MKRFKCSCVGIFSWIIAIMLSNGVDYEIAKLVSDDPYMVKSFIEENFIEFVNKVNEDTGADWNANSIEKDFPITINYLGSEIEGVFLDFNDDNGYAVWVTNICFMTSF